MILTFPVGAQEQHLVSFSWDQFWGRLTITIDGQSVVDTVRMFSLSTVKAWEFDVGHVERHRVRIEKHRLFCSRASDRNRSMPSSTVSWWRSPRAPTASEQASE
ncbi:hypothetical protein [Psychromicrobium xiongbiense]|uniref:hypothetical protein n=1 Tax=Psychromicrobium xiongbiense TaxID=3051184 RepID=UPI0025551592|nr:hypothetical protein [Psychromicrobium sp. YIM S02556]